MRTERAKRIAELNDQLRARMGQPSFGEGVPGMTVLAEGILDLPFDALGEVLTRVRVFDDFSEDNNPYGERDFGAFDHPEAGKVFWKIVYYSDESCTYGSEAPEDPKRSYRVLTIMLAHEY